MGSPGALHRSGAKIIIVKVCKICGKEFETEYVKSVKRKVIMKYEFTGETKVVFGITLKRIRATIDIGMIAKAGDLGGWIEKEGNLDQYGNAWVSGNARVSGNAWVYGDAWEKSPLYIQGSKYSFATATKDKIKVGHKIYTFKQWNANWKSLAKADGFTEEEIREYVLYFNLACELYGKQDCKIELEEQQ